MRIGLGRNEYINFNPRLVLNGKNFPVLLYLIFRPTVPYCNCFPLYIGRLKITVFHFLFSCTMIFSLLWVSEMLGPVNS